MSPLRQRLLDATRQHGFSDRTFTSYAGAVNQLQRYHGCSPAKLTPERLQPFFNYLVKERKLAPATCQVYWQAIRFFYLQVMQWSEFDVPLIVPKRPQRIPELLTRAEVARLIAQCDNLKHRTLLLCCYGCGLRVKELVSIKVRHIDGERQLLRIEQGKGSKDRAVIVSETLLKALREYWCEYRCEQWLFEGVPAIKPLSVSAAQRIFNKAKALAGLEKVGGIHSLRHAYATHQLEAGMPVHQLQQLLGHRCIQSTLRYVHWAPNCSAARGSGVDLVGALEPSDE